ncbi:MAG: hypothetical protein R3C44_19660 [Chloroflexota bacterium]
MTKQTLVEEQPLLRDCIREAFRAGTLAALAMVPFGLLFYALGLRVNEYGMAVIQTFFGDLPDAVRFLLFVVEHFIISWTVAVPLLCALLWLKGRVPGIWLGILYGVGFYIIMNSLLLPILFNDPTPWSLGFEVIYPSLIVHLIYGLVIWWVSRGFVEQHTLTLSQA